MTEKLFRRDFLKSGASASQAPPAQLHAGPPRAVQLRPPPVQAHVPTLRAATPAELQNLVGDGRKRRILLRGGVVLSSIRRSATSRTPTC